jgi:hypothetical protein
MATGDHRIRGTFEIRMVTTGVTDGLRTIRQRSQSKFILRVKIAFTVPLPSPPQTEQQHDMTSILRIDTVCAQGCLQPLTFNILLLGFAPFPASKQIGENLRPIPQRLNPAGFAQPVRCFFVGLHVRDGGAKNASRRIHGSSQRRFSPRCTSIPWHTMPELSS